MSRFVVSGDPSFVTALDLSAALAVPAKVRELPTAKGPGQGPDDTELVRRAVGGDRWAEEALYRRHVHVVGRVVARLLARSHEAEDIVQETFVSAFRDLRQLRQAESFRAWVVQLAVNLVRKRLRRRLLLRSLGLDREQDDLTLERQVDPTVDLDVRAEVAKLDEVLRRAALDDRIAWMLRYVEEYRLEEVAAACRCSLATAKRRVGRVQERVLGHLTLDLEDEP